MGTRQLHGHIAIEQKRSRTQGLHSTGLKRMGSSDSIYGAVDTDMEKARLTRPGPVGVRRGTLSSCIWVPDFANMASSTGAFAFVGLLFGLLLVSISIIPAGEAHKAAELKCYGPCMQPPALVVQGMLVSLTFSGTCQAGTWSQVSSMTSISITSLHRHLTQISGWHSTQVCLCTQLCGQPALYSVQVSGFAHPWPPSAPFHSRRSCWRCAVLAAMAGVALPARQAAPSAPPFLLLSFPFLCTPCHIWRAVLTLYFVSMPWWDPSPIPLVAVP